MAKKKARGGQKQGPPLQFRPGVELEQMLSAFAGEHDLPLNDACKFLVALAVAELDCRFFRLIKEMSQAMGGANAFPRSCDHIRISLEAARRATGMPLHLDPERAWFIRQTARDYIAARGLPVEGVGLWFLPEASERAVGEAQRDPHQRAHPSTTEDVEPQERSEGNPSRGKKQGIRFLYKNIVDEIARSFREEAGEDQGEEEHPPRSAPQHPQQQLDSQERL